MSHPGIINVQGLVQSKWNLEQDFVALQDYGCM